jgi:predicted MFS family arabinose efflux permease
MLQRSAQLYRDSFSGLSREVWLLSTVMLINRAGAMVLPFLSVYLTQQLGFSLVQAGWVLSVFGAGSVLGSYIGGQLTDRVGFYQTQFWSLFLSGFCLISLWYMQSFYAICAAVFVTSAIADAFRPAGFAAIAAYSHDENRTRAIALLRLAINLGWAIGPAMGGLLAARFGYGWLFWIDGLTCIGAALFYRLALPPKQTTTETETEDINLSSKAYRDRKYLLFLLFVLVNALVFMQFFSTLPVYFKQEMGLHEGQIGQLMALNGLLIAIVEMPLIFIVEKRYKIRHLIGLGTFLIGVAFFQFYVFGPLIGAAIGCMLLLTVGEMLSLPFISTQALRFTNTRNRGQYMALFTITYSVSHILAPNIGFQLADRLGFSNMWFILALLALLGAVGFVLLGRKTQQD